MKHNRKLLIISQVYVPDPAAVGQHVADVAEEMVRRGWQVIVYAAARGYEDSSQRYASREFRNGVDVRRLPLSSFGKGSIGVRLLAQTLFVAQAVLRGLCVPRVSALLVSTSPPFAGFAGAVVALLRRVPFIWWVMDLNPDQMIVAGKLPGSSPLARAFDWMNVFTLKRAAAVIALDHFMAARLSAKRDVRKKLHVIPPWAHENHLEVVAHDANPFRTQHRLADKFVVMYSGNAGITSPLDTLLDAASRLRDDDRIRFVFIGGGVVKNRIDALVATEKPSNIFSLPYQPLDRIKYSLSAADIHVVSIAPDAVGVVHPCKIYGAMALGKPVLALAPRNSHAGEIISQHGCGWVCEHGDPDSIIAILTTLAHKTNAAVADCGARGQAAMSRVFSQSRLIDNVCCQITALRYR